MPRPSTPLLFWRVKNFSLWAGFFFLVYVILLVKAVNLREMDGNLIFSVYSLAVSGYLLSRFLLAYFYEPQKIKLKEPREAPTITFGIPAKNEGENIAKTILQIARSDYPRDKFEIVAVNDGSTDCTLQEMIRAQAMCRGQGIRVDVVDWKENRGKRDGMAECIRRGKGEFVVFVDSDSFVKPNTARNLIKYFAGEEVAAVAGHCFVANADVNALTKMQDVRYYVAFRAYKSAEALFGAVTCCSGCLSAYRRSYLMEVIDEWANQTFLGVRCTYGDDRSLTNFLLAKGYRALFSPEAVAYTVVPDTFKKFMRQQLRWKKSWLRESFKACFFMWKKHPIMSVSFYLGAILPLIAPIAVIRALLWLPAVREQTPFFYLAGLLLMALLYSYYYYIYTKDRKWFYGVLFSVFYAFVLIWQLPYAILNIRDPKWGTR